MKKILLVLLMVLGLVPLAMAADETRAHTNYGVGGVGVGNPESTYLVLTGVATVNVDIPLQAILTSSYLPVTSATVSTTSMYVGGATGLTNTPAIFIPSQPASVEAVITHRIPKNYKSGGVLVLRVHTSGTVTAQGISFTADVYRNAPNSATITTKSPGSVVNVPTTANIQINDLSMANAATFLPGDTAAWHITVAGTDAVTRQIVGAYFKYRPHGALDGQ
jgi:hypothetical protein